MVYVLISDEFDAVLNPEIIERAALAALQHQQVRAERDLATLDLTVAVEDDARLHALNKEFLDIDAPTDVLSFPAGEEEIDPETGTAYLGDIIISYPRALEQANATRHAVTDEIMLLVVHGVLHLLGHDHAEPDEQSVMWAAQAEILGSLGVHLQ